jgi:hypothetical protein
MTEEQHRVLIQSLQAAVRSVLERRRILFENPYGHVTFSDIKVTFHEDSTFQEFPGLATYHALYPRLFRNGGSSSVKFVIEHLTEKLG